MIEYFKLKHEYLFQLTGQHIYLSFMSLVISFVLSSFLFYVLLNKKKTLKLISDVFSTLYTVPRLAMFSLLIPLFGLGKKSAITVLVI